MTTRICVTEEHLWMHSPVSMAVCDVLRVEYDAVAYSDRCAIFHEEEEVCSVAMPAEAAKLLEACNGGERYPLDFYLEIPDSLLDPDYVQANGVTLAENAMASERPFRESDKPHPLHDVVLRAFTKSPAQDRVTLAVFMQGCTDLIGDDNDAYLTVADDVLGYMEDQGILRRDEIGWHYLVDARQEDDCDEA